MKPRLYHRAILQWCDLLKLISHKIMWITTLAFPIPGWNYLPRNPKNRDRWDAEYRLWRISAHHFGSWLHENLWTDCWGGDQVRSQCWSNNFHLFWNCCIQVTIFQKIKFQFFSVYLLSVLFSLSIKNSSKALVHFWDWSQKTR